MQGIDIKTVAIFLPFVAAAILGLTYTAYGKLLSNVSVTTYLLVYCIAGIAFAGLVHFISPIKIDFTFLRQGSVVGWVTLAIVSSLIAWTLALVAVRETSAIYTAAGEISYPIFTALFTWLILQSRELTWQTVFGGLLIMAGAFIVITGKLKVGE